MPCKLAFVYDERLDRVITLTKKMTTVELAIENQELRDYRDEHLLYCDNYGKKLEAYENKIVELRAELLHAKVKHNG